MTEARLLPIIAGGGLEQEHPARPEEAEMEAGKRESTGRKKEEGGRNKPVRRWVKEEKGYTAVRVSAVPTSLPSRSQTRESGRGEMRILYSESLAAA